MSSRRRWVLAVLTAVALVTPVSAHASLEGDGRAEKLDPSFVDQLAADAGTSYFDVLVVFDSIASRSVLDGLGRPVRHYRHFPISRVLLQRGEISDLIELPSVRFVELNTSSLRPQNEEGRRIVRADELQAPAVPAVEGLTGAGVHVAVIDTGIDGTHPALRDQLERNWVIGGTVPEPIRNVGSAPMDARVYVSATPDGIDVMETFVDAGTYRVPVGAAVADASGHGTHVAGTIAADGPHDDGVAPGVRLHGYGLVAAWQLILLSYFVEAYDHLLGDPRIRIVNASIGYPACDPDLRWLHRPSFVVMRTAALDHGVLSVNSYGNFGSSKAPTGSACAVGTESTTLSLQPYVLGVGAVSKGRRLWAGSSRGLPGENHDRERALRNLQELLASPPEVQEQWNYELRPISVLRPAVVAPGVRIVSTQRPDHDSQLLTMASDPDPFYGIRTGTSMAAPNATGVAALALEAHRRHHRGADPSPVELIRILELSANRDVVFDGAAHEVGAGLVDAVAAVRLTRRAPTALTNQYPQLTPAAPEMIATGGGVLSGTVATPTVAPLAGTSFVSATTHEIQVPDGTWLLSAEVVGHSAGAFEIFMYGPGSTRPVVQSADGYVTRTMTPRLSVAFPAPGKWTIRVERSATTPPGGYLLEWETEAPVK